jgi:hypothetical protein
MNEIQNKVTCEKIESQFYEKLCSIVAQVFYPNHPAPKVMQMHKKEAY